MREDAERPGGEPQHGAAGAQPDVPGDPEMVRDRDRSMAAAKWLLIAIGAAHILGFVVYATPHRGADAPGPWFMSLLACMAAGGLLTLTLLGMDPEHPRWETRKSIFAGELTLAAGCWFLLWVQEPPVGPVAAFTVMTASATACLVALTCWYRTQTVRSYVNRRARDREIFTNER